MTGDCGCPCLSSVCTSREGDCSNVIPFSNLLILPSGFYPNTSSVWQDLRITVRPHLHCILEPCVIKDAHLTFTDPCSITHDIQKFVANVLRARIFGCIEYLISAQSAVPDMTGNMASVSAFYKINVDRVVAFIDPCNSGQCSVVVKYQNLRFDDPAEYVYGNSLALKILGEFVLYLGFINNGNFENAFSGWTQMIPPGATADTVTRFEDYVPVCGCYFALLKTDGPGSFNSISQDFYANAGDKISGWAFFRTNDLLPFNDSCNVKILSGSIVLSTPFSASVSTVGNFGRTPWTYWEYTFAETGLYTIKAEIANALDSAVDSFMGLDFIRLTSVQ